MLSSLYGAKIGGSSVNEDDQTDVQEQVWLGAALQEVYDAFDRWLYMPDKSLLDLCLAVALSRKLKGTPIWIIIIGPSGDAKSELVMAFYDGIKSETSIMLHEFTSNTLVSGFVERGHNFDLAPQLDGKLVIMPDMAQILHLHPNDKAKVWAQLRELYDGRAGRRTGSSDRPPYENLRITFLGCSTPSIDSQILVFTHLGTRELLFRTELERKAENEKLMCKVLDNEQNEDVMRAELKEAVSAFLKSRKVFDRHPIPDNVMVDIKGMVEYLRTMRATAETDGYTDELINIVYPEMPTRSLKQLVRLYRCLKSLDPAYSDDKALGVLSRIVRSSVLPIRELIMMLLRDGEELSMSRISDALRIGKKPCQKQLNILWNLGLVDRREELYDFDRRKIEYWKISESGKKVMEWMGKNSVPI